MAATDDRVYFRSMAEDDGAPAFGEDDLGIRIGIDIKISAAGNVAATSGGMSIAPDDPMNLVRVHRPRSLGGTGSKPAWAILRSAIGGELVCRPDPRKPAQHAAMEPEHEMPFTDYLSALEATGPNWNRVHV